MTMRIAYWGFEIKSTEGWPEFSDIYGFDFYEDEEHVSLF